VSWTNEVTLSHENRVITLEFVALEYTSPDRNQYRYQLEGFDPRWVEAGGNRSATYTNLEPGEYTFRVTGSNNDGVWNPVGTSLRIVMLPPFWETIWFRGILAGLIVAGLYGGSRYRTRRMEALNRELELHVRERTAKWEAANAELEAFSYTVSHDLRAPVRAINGYTRMLMEEHASSLDAEGLRMLGVIATRTKRMGDMIDDLLTFSRTGRQTIVPARVEMLDLARSVAGDLVPMDGRVHTKVTIGELPPVHGDAALLRQVWVNLISNAVKFSAGNEQPEIEIGGREEPAATVFWVRDNGVGFDMAYQHKLFGVFERLHSQEEFEGTGVGLAIAQRVMNRHGGRIWAESQQGKGATFFFSLPSSKGSG
jgi:signal transduction histidine kinase